MALINATLQQLKAQVALIRVKMKEIEFMLGDLDQKTASLEMQEVEDASIDHAL